MTLDVGRAIVDTAAMVAIDSQNPGPLEGECADWVRKKVQVRQLTGAPIAQNIFHMQSASGEAAAIAGTSDFTAAVMEQF